MEKLDVSKNIIYYTNNTLGEPMYSIVQKTLQIGLPIVSISLKPIDFGENIVVNLEPCYLTMVIQILNGLERSTADYVFFCEHDVLYPKSHFNFTPSKDDIFYYNANVWRWDYPKDRAITYDRLISLSSLCVNRQLALNHYQSRLRIIKEKYLNKEKTHDPAWARQMGFEPGTKKKKRGGFSDDDFETWRSEYPIVDIRHKRTYSPPKVSLDHFKHLPTNWREIKASEIPGWHLKELFNLWN